MAPLIPNAVQALCQMSVEEKIKFCTEEREFGNNVHITYEIFGILLDIADEYSSNRNKAVSIMLHNLNSNISLESTKISNSVKGYRRFMSKIERKKLDWHKEKLSVFSEGKQSLGCLDVFDGSLLEGGKNC